MKTTLPALLLAALATAVAPAAEPTLAEVQQELAVVKLKLELADAKLALAKKEEELKKLGAAPAAVTSAPAAGTPAAEATLRAQGLSRLNAMSTLARDAFLGSNGVSAEFFAAFSKGSPSALDADKLDAGATTLATVRANGVAGQPDATAIEQAKNDAKNLKRLLVSLGYQSEVQRAAAAGTEPRTDLRAAAATEGRASVANVNVKTADEVLLRNAGVSFSQGFGVAFSPRSQGDDASIGTLLARWNWLQRSAAAKWNRWVGQNPGEGVSQVPYRGKVEYWLEENERPDPAKRNRYTDAMPAVRRSRTWPELTSFGPFFGTAIVGDRVKFGSSTERPYLLGLGSGFGFFEDASSVLYLDLGVTVSPTSGIDHSKFFAGASFDGIVLGKLLGLTRKAHLPADLAK
jgi:hypothetical protein